MAAPAFRTWRPGERPLIKATSFVSELAEDLLLQAPEARGLVLSMSPFNYLRVILGGPNSRRESEALASSRLSRLRSRLGALVEVASEGERIAMSWLCETLCMHQATQGSRNRLEWLDFDRLLDDPVVTLTRAFDHLAIYASPAEIDDLLGGGIMRRYSKGPEHSYSAELRLQIMAQAQREHGAQVHAGMAWLEKMAVSHGPVLQALMRAATVAQPVGASITSR